MMKPSKQAMIHFFTRGEVGQNVSWAFLGDLEAYVYSKLPLSHPQKHLLYKAFLSSLIRHDFIKRELLTLIRYWYKQGYLVMLYKGFYLAEWVYTQPGQRMYIDVDILVKEHQWKEMAHIAQELGWECSYRASDDVRSRHEIGHLYSPKFHFKVDVHRSPVNHHSKNIYEYMDEKIWTSAKRIKWEDIDVFVPCPLDCVLLGLVLHRLWSSHGRILLRDYVDFTSLVEKFKFTERALLNRAQELNIEKTTVLFLQCCNPFRSHFRVAPISRLQRLKQQLWMMKERGFLGWNTILKTVTLPKILWYMAYYSPIVLRTIKISGSTSNLQEFLEKITPNSQPNPITLGVISKDINKAVGYLLEGYCQEKKSILYSAALFAIYRHLGQPVCFVQGIDPTGKKRAWLELAGIPVSSPNDRYARREYEVEFQFPAGVQT